MKNLLLFSFAFLLLGACKKKQKSDAPIPPGISIDMTDIKILPQETQLSQEGIISVAEQTLFTVTPPTSVHITTDTYRNNDTSGYILITPSTLVQRVMGDKNIKKAVRLKLKTGAPVYSPRIQVADGILPTFRTFFDNWFGFIRENEKKK